jgi:hypothetical protein
MRFTFTVDVEVERTEGKFASRDELAQQVSDALESADPGTLYGDNDGIYETTDWSVEEEMTEREAKKVKAYIAKERKLLEQERAEVQKIIEQGALKTVWLVTHESNTELDGEGRLTLREHPVDDDGYPLFNAICLTEASARADIARYYPGPDMTVVEWELQ